MTAVRARWVTLAAIAGLLAAAAIARWIWAVALSGPVLYGEGAVAHAALLSRDGLEYASGAALAEGPLRPIFTAANYPPLYFRIAALGDPFVAGRIASIAAAALVAGAIAWRARRGGALVAFALAAAWVATVPVTVWGAAVKPDMLALALTVATVLSLGASPGRGLAGGILMGAALWAKPTAALPAVALAVWSVRRGPGAGSGYLAGVLVGVIASSLALMGPSFPLAGGKAFWLHVVTWNALPWDAGQVGLLVLAGVVAMGAIVAIGGVAAHGPPAAYLAGAIGIVVLGGREGATINYLLDLSAAAALALSGAAPRLGRSAFVPFAFAAQLAVGALVLDPFGIVPGGGARTGAWGDPARIDAVRALPDGPALVEDSGLLLAAGREPIVDDLFLWSRLRASGASFNEGDRLVAAVEQGRFVAVVSEADLSRLDVAPAYERARWHPDLVRAILDRYVLDRTIASQWIYRPR
ncbi:MAG: hypothetical protein HYX56_05085 [Chloroflexi bacterium]|nr:hypothetical protein [Chloroflexota bacterium]